MVPIDLPFRNFKELLFLNCVSTQVEMRLIAVIRENYKDTDRVHVFCDSVINPKRPICTLESIVPTAFAFMDKLISWYGKEKNKFAF